jgi:Uma2 family endonuclease
MASVYTSDVVTSPPLPIAPMPQLEPGDRLTRAEFERRYEAMPELKKAELIEGVVYMPSPVRMEGHGEQHANILGWLVVYASATPGVRSADNSTVNLDNDNVPQPDALLMIEPALGGQAKIDERGYIQGAPELVAEIASSSVSIDLNDKLRVYRRNGVREYVAWRVLDRAIDWFVLREGVYVPLNRGNDAIVRSEVFPGLWLHVDAMLEGKMDAVLAALQLGVKSAEHTQFVDELAQRRNI